MIETVEMPEVYRERKKTKRSINYYSVLGIPNAASHLDIQRAFEEISRRYKNQSNLEGKIEEINSRMALINEAYSALSNPDTRQKYDEELKSVLSLDNSSGMGNFLYKVFLQLKTFGRYLRFTLILVSLLFLVIVITHFTYLEIRDPTTRIKGIGDGLLLYSLMSFFLLIISYYKNLTSGMRVWFRVISICILAFCFIVALGLFAVPAFFNFLKY